MAGKDKKNMKFSAVRLCAASILLIFFLSCQSAPNISDTSWENMTHAPLEKGGFVYIFGNARQSLPILDLLQIEELKDRQVRQIAERTKNFTAALFPEANGRYFQLAAWGNYPSARGFLALNTNRHWERQQSVNGQYWYSEVNGLSIAMTSNRVFAVSSIKNTPLDPVTMPGTQIPEGFLEFSRKYPFSCWLENPAPVFFKVLNDLGFPVQVPVRQFFFSLYPAQKAEHYEAVIRIQFENQQQARALASLLNLASGISSNISNSLIASIFFTNPPVQNGNLIDINTAALNETELQRLFGMFLF